MTDQHRLDTLGCYGGNPAHTPHLDDLARRGTRFVNHFTPTAICTPARASLLTGAAPFRHRLLANYERNVGYIEDLPDGQFTFADALAKEGYSLTLNGKWHAGTHKTAADYGFEAIDYPGWHNPVDHPDYGKYLRERDLPPFRFRDPIRGVGPNGAEGILLAARLEQPVEATFESYLTTRTIEALERYVGGRPGSPFFLATHYFGPHLPYLLPDDYFDMFDPDSVELPASVAETFDRKPPVQRNYSAHWAYDTLPEETSRKVVAAYRGYATMIDAQIGRILDALDRLGLATDTAIFFTADHGEFTGAHRLHDKGPAMYDDIYRIPGIITVPGMPAGQARQELTTLTDMTATLLDLAGADPAEAVDGISLVPLLRGESPQWRDSVVCEFHGHHFPYPQRMSRDHGYKLVINPESINEFYDLLADPDELDNRYDDPALSDVRGVLMRRLYEQLRERGDNFYHWMTAMYDVEDPTRDASLGRFETG